MIPAAGHPLACAGGPPGPAAMPEKRTALPRALAGRPVLIVEDEAVIAWTLESLLEDLGFASVRIARDATEAVRIARADPPGLILSDINLGAGGADGITVVAAIRSLVPAPALFITAHAGAEERDRIDRHVPHAPVLRKPVDADALAAAIAALLGEGAGS